MRTELRKAPYHDLIGARRNGRATKKRVSKTSIKAGKKKVLLAAKPTAVVMRGGQRMSEMPVSLTPPPAGYAQWLAALKRRIHAA